MHPLTCAGALRSDSLSTIRQLKEHNTEVFFEKENIWTFDSKGELLITIMSSLAQEESRSISENVTWGHRKRMADGKVAVPYSRFLGYDKGEDGNLVLNPEEAKTIKPEIAAKGIRKRELERFIQSVEKLPDVVTEFDEALWGSLVDHLTVNAKDDIVFTMSSGMEIKA